MFINIIARALSNLFTPARENHLVRLFEIEYAKEARQLKKAGTNITEGFVKEYLNLK